MKIKLDKEILLLISIIVFGVLTLYLSFADAAGGRNTPLAQWRDLCAMICVVLGTIHYGVYRLKDLENEFKNWWW